MRIAFYAPMKPPNHPVPSGDRTMARNLMAALRCAGHRVGIASRFVTYDGIGDATRQAAIARAGVERAERLLARYRRIRPTARPDVWFTYHLYHKAPDPLGPAVKAALGIPYVVAEASHGDKHGHGPWRCGAALAAAAIRQADGVIGINLADYAGVAPLLAADAHWHFLPPFLDPTPFLTAAAERAWDCATRRASGGANVDRPTLLAVAMMRPGDKLASYQVLARALAALPHRPWCLVVAGDGPARDAVQSAFAPIASRVTWRGEVPTADLPALYAVADLLVWPAIGEAYGMSLLEAQATGLPVVAGRSQGVASIVRDGVTGLLTPPGDASAFAAAVERLIQSPAERQKMAARAVRAVLSRHSIAAAAVALDAILVALCRGRPGRPA